MTSYDLILATILAKEGNPYFKEEALDFGLRIAINGNRRLEDRLLSLQSGGSSPERSTCIDRSLSIMNGFHILEYTGDWQQMYIPGNMKKIVTQTLIERYDSDVVEELKPFAKAVWEAAAGYR